MGLLIFAIFVFWMAGLAVRGWSDDYRYFMTDDERFFNQFLFIMIILAFIAILVI